MRPNAISLNRLPDLSLNLLGGRFKSSDTKYRTLGSAGDEWTGEKVNPADFVKSFEVVNDKALIFINLMHLHRQEVPYLMDPSNNKEAKNFALIFQGKLAQFSGKIDIKHFPTKMNYWHVQLDIMGQDFGQGPGHVRKASTTWQKNICESILTQIFVVKARPLQDLNYKISKRHYLESQ